MMPQEIPAPTTADQSKTARLNAFVRIRERTESLVKSLPERAFEIQTMSDVSPTKWHLAHTAWFFETFVLKPFQPKFRPFHPKYEYFFNSYYNAVGEQYPRSERGRITEPGVEDVFAYRRHVDRAVVSILETAEGQILDRMRPVVELGLQHEEQHQELIVMDVKHVLAHRPDLSAAGARGASEEEWTAPDGYAWKLFPEGLYEAGFSGRGFCFDNERARHKVYLRGFQLADRLVTNGEYLDFMNDGGYERADLWLSDGWAERQTQSWNAPLYWELREGRWWTRTLTGACRVNPAEPVAHVSFYEAEAFAAWAGARLATEIEWEIAAREERVEGNFLESGARHPRPARTPLAQHGLRQMFGDLWEWTRSAYGPYPGYRPPEGAFGEYNGKFMCNQMVLRGGSCATPKDHIRVTYRNFFYPHQRWPFTGFRLARDGEGH